MDSLLIFLPRLLQATLLTGMMFVIISISSLTIGLSLALSVKFVSTAIAAPLRLFSWFFRATPELIVLFVSFYALPSFGIRMEPVTAVILSFVLVRTAYDYELFRGGLLAIETGQIEACRALGLSRWKMISRVVVPQLIRITAAPWITLAVGALKGLALASAVGVSDIVFVARQGIISTGEPFMFIAAAAVLYGAISCVLMAASIVIEKRTDFLRDGGRV